MDPCVTFRKDYLIGQTLDVSLNPVPSPFTDASQIAFITAFEEKENKSNFDNQGQCKFVATLAQNQSDKSNALSVNGKLDMSYGPVSGDAYVNFAMNNIQGSLDLSVIISAKQEGRILKNSRKEIIGLKLRQTVLDKINNGNYTKEQFFKDYGSWLIFGFDYGGEILFESIYSTNSSSDKLSVAGGLSISYAKVGFNISGSADANYNDNDIKKATNITTKYTINPSYNNPLISGNNGIIQTLEKIADPDPSINNNNIKGNLFSKMQQLLGGKTLDKVNAIVYKLDSIGCINDAFYNMNQQKNTRNIQNFFKFTNPLYSTIKEILISIPTISKNYDKYNPNNKPKDEINLWLIKLENIGSKMGSINGDKLYEYSNKWYNYIQDDKKDNNTCNQKEINKEFYKMNKNILQQQFKEKLLNPYNKMMNKKNSDQKDDQKDNMSIAEGEYIFESVLSGKVLDVSGSGMDNGVKLIQWDRHGDDNQLFIVKKLNINDGYVSIQCKQSKKYWDIGGASNDIGAKLIQYDYHAGDNQRFKFINTGNDKFKIECKHSKKSLQIQGNSHDNDAKIIQSDYQGHNSQLFFLKPI